MLLSTAAFAQAVEGCNPAIMDAMQKKAQAKVAQDIATTEQIVVKPDSVLAMTCFGRSAGVSAERGGNLFSGSFLGNANFASVITDALAAFFAQFDESEGKDNAVVDYNLTAPEDNADCTGVEDLWERVKEKGVSGGVPYLTMAELMAGAIPGGAGTRFTSNWETAVTDNIFSDLQTAIGALPIPAIPSFAGANRVCDVLIAAGVPGATCP